MVSRRLAKQMRGLYGPTRQQVKDLQILVKHHADELKQIRRAITISLTYCGVTLSVAMLPYTAPYIDKYLYKPFGLKLYNS